MTNEMRGLITGLSSTKSWLQEGQKLKYLLGSNPPCSSTFPDSTVITRGYSSLRDSSKPAMLLVLHCDKTSMIYWVLEGRNFLFHRWNKKLNKKIYRSLSTVLLLASGSYQLNEHTTIKCNLYYAWIKSIIWLGVFGVKILERRR